MKIKQNTALGTEVAWTPQMYTDERVHNTIMRLQEELRKLNRTHRDNLQLLEDLELFYGMYFRPLLEERSINDDKTNKKEGYDSKIEKLREKLENVQFSENKKVVSYNTNIDKTLKKFVFAMMRDFQQSMSYFYKGKIKNTTLDDLEL